MKTYFASPLALRFIEVPLYLILFIFQKVGGGGGEGGCPEQKLENSVYIIRWGKKQQGIAYASCAWN